MPSVSYSAVPCYKRLINQPEPSQFPARITRKTNPEFSKIGRFIPVVTPRAPPQLHIGALVPGISGVPPYYSDSSTMRQAARLLKHVPLIKFVGGPHSHGMSFFVSEVQLHAGNVKIEHLIKNHTHLHPTVPEPPLLPSNDFTRNLTAEICIRTTG